MVNLGAIWASSSKLIISALNNAQSSPFFFYHSSIGNGPQIWNFMVILCQGASWAHLRSRLNSIYISNSPLGSSEPRLALNSRYPLCSLCTPLLGCSETKSIRKFSVQVKTGIIGATWSFAFKVIISAPSIAQSSWNFFSGNEYHIDLKHWVLLKFDVRRLCGLKKEHCSTKSQIFDIFEINWA